MSDTYRTVNGRKIVWQGHACEAADVHPNVRLIWTICEPHQDVPANTAYLACGDHEIICPRCKERP